ncbi:MAG: hypothetical protein FJ040_10120, partial [Chloroflexi bacterium]|nr:hypothetical protein [Chloroflexota bacterium]
MIHTKPIMFVAGGTRGDVQPFIVLAKAMQDQHILVSIAASKRWQAVITQHQIPFIELPPDPVELLLQPRFKHALTPTPTGLRSTVDYLNEMRPYVYALERAIPALLHHASAIIATVASQWVSRPHVWDSLPFVWGLFQPVVPTAAFATPLIEHTIHPALNRFSHQYMNHAMWFSWSMHTAQFRGGLMKISQQSAFVACSRELLPDWHDIQSRHAVTGWLGQLPNASALPEEIRAFINHDAPFAVATFGTPAANESADMYDAVINATQRCGLRLVLHVPERFAALNVPDGVVVLAQDVNHAELFARAHIVLHHGGAGTTHACVAAGVPMV